MHAPWWLALWLSATLTAGCAGAPTETVTLLAPSGQVNVSSKTATQRLAAPGESVEVHKSGVLQSVPKSLASIEAEHGALVFQERRKESLQLYFVDRISPRLTALSQQRLRAMAAVMCEPNVDRIDLTEVTTILGPGARPPRRKPHGQAASGQRVLAVRQMLIGRHVPATLLHILPDVMPIASSADGGELVTWVDVAVYFQ